LACEIAPGTPSQVLIDATSSINLTFLTTAYGKPFSALGFGNRFREWCNKAGVKHCSAHGLRKLALVSPPRMALAKVSSWRSSDGKRCSRALCLSPQCGFASTEEGNVLAEEEQWAKLRLIVEIADEVWG
jgi:hypothetical protein